MEAYEIYNDIASRTGGDIYLGVVGPVRTGKSTFIKRFMELMVLPNIEDKNVLGRAVDEMPQSADGKTIMTTQPKFVPAEAVEVTFAENVKARIRLIDCVGYLIEGALGATEGEKERMVRTPWSDKEIPFEQAAEIGTTKVINEHSTIGILVTTDGSITGMPRANYISSEEKAVNRLKAIGKPFVIVLNSSDPTNSETVKLADSLSEKYQVPILTINVATMEVGDVERIMQSVLSEFPVRMIDVKIPEWMCALDQSDELIVTSISTLENITQNVYKMGDATKIVLNENVYFVALRVDEVNMGKGVITITLEAKPELFYEQLSKSCGQRIDGEFSLMSYVLKLSGDAERYSKLKEALTQVEETGYGVVVPSLDEMVLEEPEIMKQAGRFGVRLKASAPSLHIMKVDVRTEVNPIVGSEQQSEELVKYLLEEFETNKKGIWETNMFGKSLSNLVNEGLSNKIAALPNEAKVKLRKTLGKIVNDGKGGMICILL